jgi:hypothetical protein
MTDEEIEHYFALIDFYEKGVQGDKNIEFLVTQIHFYFPEKIIKTLFNQGFFIALSGRN